LQIPERYKPGFIVLAGLSASSYQEFLTAVKSAPNTFATTRELDVWISSEVKGIPPGDIAKLIESVISIHRLLSRFPAGAQKLAAEVTEAAADGIDNFRVADGVDFAGRLAELLAADSFNILSLKAKELQLQAERLFCEARVLTDVRPVFGEKAGDPPTAMVVIHTLKIVFHEALTHKEFYLALDAEDIASLKKTLERAEDKARSLKALLDTNGLRSINL
jgi:hypothetical protein